MLLAILYLYIMEIYFLLFYNIHHILLEIIQNCLSYYLQELLYASFIYYEIASFNKMNNNMFDLPYLKNMSENNKFLLIM
jgi:hypothetical protein